MGILLYKSSDIQKIYVIYAFLIWILVGVLSILFTGGPPFYLINYFKENSDIDLLARASIGTLTGLSVRVTGPTLNVTGNFLAMILNLAIFDQEFCLRE